MKQQIINILKHVIFIITICVIAFIMFVFSNIIQLFDRSIENTIGTFAWVIVFLVLPVIAVYIPFNIKYSKNASFKKAWLTAIISILVYSIIAFGTIGITKAYLKDFTSENGQNTKMNDILWLMI